MAGTSCSTCRDRGSFQRSTPGGCRAGGRAGAGWAAGPSLEARGELEGRWSLGGHGKEGAAVPCSAAQGSYDLWVPSVTEPQKRPVRSQPPEQDGTSPGEVGASWESVCTMALCAVLPFPASRTGVGLPRIPAADSPEWHHATCGSHYMVTKQGIGSWKRVTRFCSSDSDAKGRPPSRRLGNPRVCAPPASFLFRGFPPPPHFLT